MLSRHVASVHSQFENPAVLVLMKLSPTHKACVLWGQEGHSTHNLHDTDLLQPQLVRIRGRSLLDNAALLTLCAV